MHKAWGGFIAFFVMAVVSVGYCDELPQIKVGHVGHDHQIALYVAADEGETLGVRYGVYLKPLKDMEVYELYEKGKPVAQVHLIQVGGGSKMPAALDQGHIEMGLGGLGPVAKFIDKGSEIKVLAPLNNDGDALVLSRRFSVKSWKEFAEMVKKSTEPVRLGYKDPMAVAYLILIRALDEEGITYGVDPVGPDGKPVKVIMVNIQGLDNAPPSLDAGIVDGVVVNEPMASLLEHKGIGYIAADLSTLPPKGMWEGHPCCVVAATRKAIEEKRAVVKSMLKVIAAGADVMALEPAKALKAEVRWTRTPAEVGEKSIRNVEYVIAPGKLWLGAVDRWINLMLTGGLFSKKFANRLPDDIRNEILDLSLMEEAMSEMDLKSVRK